MFNKNKRNFHKRSVSIALSAAIILTGTPFTTQAAEGVSSNKLDNLLVRADARFDGSAEAAADSHVMENSVIKVTVDKSFPQALSYELKETQGLLYGGYPDAEHKININGVLYNVGEVIFNENGDGSIDYILSIPDFKGGLSINYHFALEGNELVKSITEISGAGEPDVLSIQLQIPVLRATSTQENAKIAFEKEAGPDRYGNYVGDVLGDVIGTVASQSDYTEYTSWGFLYTPKIAGSVYNNLIDIPLQAKVQTIDGVKHAALYEREYNYRLSYKPNGKDGLLPEASIPTGRTFESRIYIGGDTNENNIVDWQDGALWVRDQLPKRPKNLEDFYAAGGAWQQTHGTFPDNATTSTVSTHYSVFAPQMRQVFYQTEGSPQSFEVAGWQQHGHDWRWGDWKQPVNPGAGGMDAMLNARNEMLKYGGDLSFHVNHEITVPEADSYDENMIARKSNGSLQTAGGVFGQSAFRIKSYFMDWAAGHTEDRINNLVQEDFWAPTIIYNDQMWDEISPYNGVYGVHESFAKSKIIETFGKNGTNVVTEGYQPTNIRNGLLMAKYRSNNNSRIEDFVTAGVLIWQFSAPKVADLFGGHVTGDYRSGNLNAKDNNFANAMIEDNYIYAYLSAYMRQKPAMEYIDNSDMTAVRWGDDLIAKLDKKNGNKFMVTEGNVTIADGTDRFIPDLSGENKIYVYSKNGINRDWVLPASWAGVTKVDRYELTESGKAYIDRIDVVDNKVNLYTPATIPYIIVPATGQEIAAGSLNNAIGKIATATSQAGTDIASHAIDNDKSTVWTANGGNGSSLEIDLGRETEVNRIEIMEQGKKISAYKLQYADGGNWVDIKTGTTIGNDMRAVFPNIRSEKVRLLIISAGNNPQIAEFKIFADANLSMTAKASAKSGNWDKLVAKDDRGVNVTYNLDARDLRAKDGSLETYWRPSETADTWLEMAFSRKSPVNRAVIHEIGDQVTGFKLQVFNGSSWIDTYTGTTIGETLEVNFPTESTTKVRLLITSSTGTPKISEFQLFGVDSNVRNEVPQLNLALNKSATQSSVYTASLSPAVASRAVDGNTSGNWNVQSIAATNGVEDNPWWQVDLGNESNIGEIKLFGRDGKWTRLAFVDISVLDKDGNEVWSYYQEAQPNPSVSIKVTGGNGATVKGQIVKIKQRKIVGRANEPLEIAEVEVYAPKEVISEDKTELQKLYNDNFEKEKGNYTDESWEAFVAAIQAAKIVLDNPKATYDDVRLATRTLFYAIEKLIEKPDTVPPITSATVTGTAGADDWYTSEVKVSLQASDDESGVASTEYALTVVQSVYGTQSTSDFVPYTSPIVLGDGIYQIQYRSTDQAGNVSAIESITVKSDIEVPSFMILVNGNPLENGDAFEDSQPVTFDLQSTDNLSGVATQSITVDGKSYEPGTALNLAGQLGTHNIQVTVTDQAGNSGKWTANVTITTSGNSMQLLLNAFSASGDVSGPLQSQLSNNLSQALSQLAKGHKDQAVKHMKDFLKHMDNTALQSNISDNAKKVLTTDANAVIEAWSV